LRRPGWIGVCLVLLVVGSLAIRVANSVPGLNDKRFWDERFSIANVKAVHASSSLRPQNAFYLGLNHLPQAAVLWLIDGVQDTVGVEWLPVYGPDGIRMTREGRLVCRIIQALYGTLSIWLLFLIGRRLFSMPRFAQLYP